MNVRKWGIGGEGEICSVYAGEVWLLWPGFVEPFFDGRGYGGYDSVYFYQVGVFLCVGVGGALLRVFSDVFQELCKTVCGKPGFFKIYGKSQGIVVFQKEYDRAEKGISYL